MKKTLEKIVPSSVFKLYRKIFKKPEYGYFGDYKQWKDALVDSGGYDDDVILDKVKSASLKVASGDAVYERDSSLFYKEDYNWPLVGILSYIRSHKSHDIDVIDFGGSLGSTFVQNKKMLRFVNSWTVVEQKKFADTGRNFFESEKLKFKDSLDQCRGDAILLSAVLQYLDKPYELLASLDYEYIIIDRTSFLREPNRERLTVQRVPPSIYDASYPAWFFDIEKFKNFISKRYKLIVEFDAIPTKTKWEIEKGFLFKKI